jgi:hypothetical protein
MTALARGKTEDPYVDPATRYGKDYGTSSFFFSTTCVRDLYPRLTRARRSGMGMPGSVIIYRLRIIPQN